MSDQRVRTQVQTDTGWLDFQDYFVRQRAEPAVRAIAFVGIEAARPAPGVLEAIAAAERILICPSNPFVSVGPILAVPGLWAALAAARVPIVAVTPIIGGAAVKGPADRMLASLGHEVSAAGVAALYQGLASHFILDVRDAALASRIEALGMRVMVTDTLMTDAGRAQALARVALAA
jgi:LPPG:FO 2-phospho-L-lactate transferase